MGSVFLATTEGLYRSIDFGNVWVRIDSGFLDNRINQVVSNYDGKLYAISDSTIYFSSNDGDDWFPLNNLPAGRIWDLACDSSNNLYLTINIPGVSVAIGYRSTDNGITWQQFGSSCPTLFWSINISPDGNLFVQGQFGIYKSIDKGESWNLINSLTGTTCISFYSDNNLFSGSYTGVRKSINGGIDWQLIGLPGSFPRILSLTTDSIGNIFAGAGGNLPEVFRSTNHGQSWVNVSGQFDGIIISALSIDNSGNLFAGSYGGGIYYSSDYGVSWVQRNSGLTSLSISSIKFDPLGDVYAGTWDGQIFRSSNYGNQWISCDVGVMLLLVDDIAISQSGNIYIGTSDGVFVSNNQGLSWIHLNSNGWPGQCQSLSVAVTSQENIFADASGQGIYQSTDLGNSWVLLSSDFYSPILDISFNSLGYLFAAGANGVFRSTDNGNNWSLFNSGLAEWNGVNALVQDKDGRMIAGTEDRGVCWTSSITSIQEDEYVLKEFFLSQNYPNLFNPSTKISWQSPVSSHQTLIVYEVLGNEVATLVDEFKPAGSYEVEFNSENLASGVYIYRFQTTEFTETKKMVLLR